jgi:hypothetical protein
MNAFSESMGMSESSVWVPESRAREKVWVNFEGRSGEVWVEESRAQDVV